MSRDLDDWLAKQTGGDWKKLKAVHDRVKVAHGKAKGKGKDDLTIIDNVMTHILTTGAYPTDGLDTVDFTNLV